MTSDANDSSHARYQQVLAWRAEGMTYREIGRRLGVTGQRAKDLDRQAQRWQQRLLTSPTTPAQMTLTTQTCVQALPISAGAKRALWQAGMHTVGQVAALSDAAILGIRGIGRKTVATLRTYPAAQHHPAPGPQSEEDA